MNFKTLIKNRIKQTRFYNKYLHRQYAKADILEAEKNTIIRGALIEKYIPANGIGAELGVMKGNFSRVLLQYSKAKQLHLIDPWYLYESHWDWAGGNSSTVDALCKVLQENKESINNKRVIVHVDDDLKALTFFPDHYFDWVYIDSSHQYEHTRNELNLLLTKVKQNGIICGDDWQPDINHRHHGVFKAVNEFIKLHHYKIIYADDQNLQWFIKKEQIDGDGENMESVNSVT